MCMHACTLCGSVCICLCIDVCVYVSVCRCLCVCVCVYMIVCIWLGVCVCVYMTALYVCAYMAVHIHLFVNSYVKATSHPHSGVFPEASSTLLWEDLSHWLEFTG